MIKNNNNLSNNFNKKIVSFIMNEEINIKDINILEFGVREGRSTKMFLDLCKKNKGKLISIDVDDYSNLFNDQNWTFIKTRDDDYKKVSSYFLNDFDIILIDSFHEPDHVLKLIYTYWKHLKINGSMYIDDISWLPYMKGKWRDHRYTENINRNTFYKILEMHNSNYANIDLTFNFNDSGMCKLIKQNSENLQDPIDIKPRGLAIKSKIKKLLRF